MCVKDARQVFKRNCVIYSYMEAKNMRGSKTVLDIEQSLENLGFLVIYDKRANYLGQAKGGFSKKFAIYKK